MGRDLLSARIATTNENGAMYDQRQALLDSSARPANTAGLDVEVSWSIWQRHGQHLGHWPRFHLAKLKDSYL